MRSPATAPPAASRFRLRLAAVPRAELAREAVPSRFVLAVPHPCATAALSSTRQRPARAMVPAKPTAAAGAARRSLCQRSTSLAAQAAERQDPPHLRLTEP